MAILLDEINTIATKKINPGVVDNYFKSGPLMAYLKTRFNRRWTGPQIQENYLYGVAGKGGAYKKGATFNVTKQQNKSGMLFGPRYYRVNVSEYLEDLEVEAAGPTAVFSMLKVDLGAAAIQMSAILEIAAFHHGQNIGGDDRTAELNGLEEADTNGIDATWSGKVFTSYGGQTRADVAPALNSPTGVISPSVALMSFRMLEQSFQSAVIGAERPKLAITTNRVMGSIAETFTPQQKVDTMDPEINWPGFKFNGATIVQGQYCPGRDGVNDPNLGDYSTTQLQGETFWWANPGPQGDDAYLRLYVAQSSKFAFGFTGFKGARDDNMVAGQILFGGNLTVRAPRLQRALYGLQVV